MRSFTAGTEVKVHLAPVALRMSRPVRLSIAVADPPACLRPPGSFFAAATKSAMVR